MCFSRTTGCDGGHWFLATGPWDESSQMGISDTIDKKIAQYLDRDDMIATVMSTFVSTTVHCALP